MDELGEEDPHRKQRKVDICRVDIMDLLPEPRIGGMRVTKRDCPVEDVVCSMMRVFFFLLPAKQELP